MPPSIVFVQQFDPRLDCISCACLIRRHPPSLTFGGCPHRYSFLEVGHLSICFWALGAQISDVRHLWVRKVVCNFSHYGWLTAVTVCCSKTQLQFLHCPGKNFRCSWSKFKSLVFQVSTPDLEVSLNFGLQAWFISRFLTSILLGIGGLSLVPVSRDLQFITSGGRNGFDSNITPPFLDLSCSYVKFTFFVCRNSYGLIKTEICIYTLLSCLLDRQEQEK